MLDHRGCQANGSEEDFLRCRDPIGRGELLHSREPRPAGVDECSVESAEPAQCQLDGGSRGRVVGEIGDEGFGPVRAEFCGRVSERFG